MQGVTIAGTDDVLWIFLSAWSSRRVGAAIITMRLEVRVLADQMKRIIKEAKKNRTSRREVLRALGSPSGIVAWVRGITMLYSKSSLTHHTNKQSKMITSC